MDAYLLSLTSGTSGLELAYSIAFFGVLAGLIRGHASWRKYLELPLNAAVVMLLALVIVPLVTWILHVSDIIALRFLLGVLITSALGYRCGLVSAPDDPRRASPPLAAARPAAPAAAASRRKMKTTARQASGGADLRP